MYRNNVKNILSEVKISNNNEVNDLIQSEDKKLTIAAGDLTFTPTPKDKVLISSIVYKIVSVTINEQNNTPITLELFLRS